MDLSRLLTDAEFRQFLTELIIDTGALNQSYMGGGEGGKDEAIYREGKRSTGLFLLKKIFTEYPEACTIMINEHLARLDEQERIRSERRDD